MAIPPTKKSKALASISGIALPGMTGSRLTQVRRNSHSFVSINAIEEGSSTAELGVGKAGLG
jgi:hypothetical protein